MLNSCFDDTVDWAAAVNTFIPLVKLCTLPYSHVMSEWMPKAQGHGDVSALTPARTLTSFTGMESVRKGGGWRGETKWKRGCFCDCRDNRLCPKASWGYKGHQCHANKGQRHLFAWHTRTHSETSFWGRHRNKKVIVGSCLCWKRMEKRKSINKQCNCVHVCHYMLGSVHPHRHAQWKQTDGWYHYSKHRWQEGQIDSSLIEHFYVWVCVRKREKLGSRSFRWHHYCSVEEGVLIDKLRKLEKGIFQYCYREGNCSGQITLSTTCTKTCGHHNIKK